MKRKFDPNSIKSRIHQLMEEISNNNSVPKQENWLDETNYDVIVLGTGLTECFLAA